MSQRKLNADMEREIVDAYREWDPRTSSADTLAAQFGVTRQSLYRVLRKHGVALKSHERPMAAGGAGPSAGTLDLERSVGSAVLDRLRLLEEENADLRARLDALSD